MEKENNESIAAEIISEVLNEVTESKLYREFTGSDWGQYKIISSAVKRAAKSKGFEENVDEIIETVKKAADIRSNALKITKNAPEIEILQRAKPEKYPMANNKLINSMTKDVVPYDGTAWGLFVHEGKTAEERIVSLNYKSDLIKINEKDSRFTTYDREVHNSICSLHDEGLTVFSPQQVYRTMNHLHEGESVSPQSVSAVTRSIDKMRRMEVKVDYSEETKEKHKTLPPEKLKDFFVIEGFILSADKIRASSGGHDVTAYRMHSKPLIYEYAQLYKQVITVPSKLLGTKDIIRNTPEVIVIRAYLIRRIEEMKNPKNRMHSKNILFQTLFDEIGVKDPAPKKTKKVRDAIELLLSHFTDDGYIQGFDFYKSGRTFKGIKISI